MIRILDQAFDRLEDKIRRRLSHYPILYSILGGVGVVLFWRGVWHTVDYLAMLIQARDSEQSSIDLQQMLWWDGPLSLIAGTVLLLLSGIFVSSFIGNEIILSGLRGEKKLSEKTEQEVKTEVGAIADIKSEVQAISRKLDELERRLK